jgi:hypothetical protein
VGAAAAVRVEAEVPAAGLDARLGAEAADVALLDLAVLDVDVGVVERAGRRAAIEHSERGESRCSTQKHQRVCGADCVV